MSFGSRLKRVESKLEDNAGPEDAAPVSEEHAHVRDRLRAVEAEFVALAPEDPGDRRRPLSEEEDRLIDEYLDLRELEDRIVAGAELGGVA